MRKRTFILIMLVLSVLVLSTTGCSITKSDNKPSVQGSSYAVDEAVNKQVVELVRGYYTDLYSASIDSYRDASVNGNITPGITKYISKQTQKDAVNNPEMGVHYPRFVELNGVAVISYEILKNSDTPEISADYIGKSGNAMLYFARVNLKAKCVPSKAFDDSYTRNSENGAYLSNKQIDVSQADLIKVQARYDVEVVKDDDGYKILSAREIGSKMGNNNRLFVLNNDFIKRLPYLSIEKSVENESYVQNADVNTFNKEKDLITNYFESVKDIDNEQTNLLYLKWNKNQEEFKSCLKSNGINVDGTVDIGTDYKTSFTYDSFPVKTNMLKIKTFKNLQVAQDLAYTDKNHIYNVKMDATVLMKNGLVGEENNYGYSYTVVIKNLKISSMKLNEYVKK